MKYFNLALILVVSAIFLSSCTGNSVYLKNKQTFAPTDAKTIQIYSNTNPSAKFDVIGYVSTYSSDANGEGDKLKNNLRTQAAKIGANAIIGFKLNTAVNGGGGAQGVAVRYIP